ncbi:MAG: cobalamin-binding domain-containing protein, partial [Pseudomonadota bacterium]
MKISAYHKLLGDKVRFVKGFNRDVPYEYWDRIYVTTLFTYHWKLSVEDILFYKNLVHGDTSRLFVGGIMASLMSDELWRETGVQPFHGVMDRPGLLDEGNELVVDDMIPDYELFNGSTEKYTLLDSYFGYSTRGCVNNCDFCGVPKLEPNFIEYRGLIPYIKKIDELYGEKKDLVLFDNNILASAKFNDIIADILDVGFE